ncbi:hypothetical protein TNCV_347451 [Trichonephila clavipes]|nr:hypothetical protein TNCV_347451 [Trichonephila clavipes]
MQRDHRIATCVSSLSWYKNDPFLTRIVTGNKKWVMYHNVKRCRNVCPPSDPSAFTSVVEHHPKKVLLCAVRCAGKNSVGGLATQPNNQ